MNAIELLQAGAGELSNDARVRWKDQVQEFLARSPSTSEARDAHKLAVALKSISAGDFDYLKDAMNCARKALSDEARAIADKNLALRSPALPAAGEVREAKANLYRIKIEPVQADQWWPGKPVDGVQEVAYDSSDSSTKSSGYGMCGAERVNPGDWIVKNHPAPAVVPHDEFNATYEPVAFPKAGEVSEAVVRECITIAGSHTCDPQDRSPEMMRAGIVQALWDFITSGDAAATVVGKALKFTEPPFSVYHNGVEIGDKNGHVCSAENPDIAKDIVAALNALALPQSKETGETVGATHMRRPEYLTAWLFDGASTMPLWLIEKYHSQPLPEHRKGQYATAADGEFWRWFDPAKFNELFVPAPPAAAPAGTVGEALSKGFMTATAGDGEYQIKIGFETLADMQAAHKALAALASSPLAREG